jgi:hypothetical protein
MERPHVQRPPPAFESDLPPTSWLLGPLSARADDDERLTLPVTERAPVGLNALMWAEEQQVVATASR